MQSLSSFRKPDSDRTLGIEWELVFSENNKDVSLGEYIGFFYVTFDGSITTGSWPKYGRELVSQPLTPKWLVKELERVNRIIPPHEHNDSCGIHVHASRKWVSAKKVDHLTAFLSGLEQQQYLEAFGRFPNSYCRHIGAPEGTASRYCALNTTNKATVEFRMFRSGDVKWAQYCVKLVEYMIINSAHLNQDAFFAFVDMEQPK